MIGLGAVFCVTLLDKSGSIAALGRWLKLNRGPDVVIVMIFFFSGLVLNIDQVKSGLRDMKGVVTALFVIFVISPVAALLFRCLPLDSGVLIGVFIVAAMPTTLSTGVVMTGAAGGNMAHALFITIVSNLLSAITIPVTLTLLLESMGGDTGAIDIDEKSIVFKIIFFAIMPLAVGFVSKSFFRKAVDGNAGKIQIANQLFVLGIVWMAMSGARATVIDNGDMVPLIVAVVFAFHAVLAGGAYFLSEIFKLKKGRRESVILMGGQKTLPLSVIIQITVFPQYGLALVVCVVHHIVHLIMDGWLVGKLAAKED